MEIDEKGRDLRISFRFVLGYDSGKQLRDYSESKRMTKRSRGGKIVRRSAVWGKTPAAAKTAAGVMVELRGIEPLSESNLTGLSPGADDCLHSLAGA